LTGLPVGLGVTGTTSFAIARFDRSDSGSVHQEDLAQVLGVYPPGKYDHTFESVAAIVLATTGTESYLEFVRRLALMLAVGNDDAHLKNWSFVYPDRITATLAPVYDQVCTVAIQGNLSRELGLKFAGSRSALEVDERSFERLAAKAGADPTATVEVAREAIRSLASAWPTVTDILGSDHSVAAALRSHWTKVPMLRNTVPGALG
jgi:serine/threonine-protein kinase HipA